jgi:hypothetical protein
MVKDERLRNVRAEAGRLGGNPNLVKQKDNQQPNQTANQDHNHEDKHRENHDAKQSPTPSSSSSSSLKTPPIPPKGGATPKRAKRESAVALKTFLAECKEKQEKPIPDEDSVFDYAEQAGIPSDFLRLHWKEFLARYNTPDAKRYKRWRDVFRKSVRGNWFRLWYVDSGGQYVLTTVGVQAQNAHKPREAA